MISPEMIYESRRLTLKFPMTRDEYISFLANTLGMKSIEGIEIVPCECGNDICCTGWRWYYKALGDVATAGADLNRGQR